MRRFVAPSLMLAFLLLACDDKPVPTPPAEPAVTQPAAPATAGGAETKPEPAPAPVAAPVAVAKATPAQAPQASAPTMTPAAQAMPAAVTPMPAAAPAPIVVPAPVASAPAAVPVAAPAASMESPSLAKNGHAAAGSDKCRMCHRIQHDSWSAGTHPKKGLDCEACHGNGADYKAMPVMKNSAAAKAAGLVTPELGFCRKCHGAKADAALVAKVHAHKAK